MRLVPLLLVALLLAACDSDGGSEADPRPEPPPPAITRAELGEHLVQLEAIAERHGGDRAVATPGYRASADYVESRLRAASWQVRRQTFDVPSFEVRRASLAVDGRRLERSRDYQVLTYSGSGSAEGPMRPLGNGCTEGEFAGLGEGEVPVVGRGDCFFRVKAANAERAGARGLVVLDDSPTRRGVPSGTLTAPGIGIPVVLATDAALDGEEVSLTVRASSRTRESVNVIAEPPGREGERVVMAGGHLDSAPGGPGINDNGSGTAALIEIAEAIRANPPGATVRLAFWGAEEAGLVGSRHYVRSLSRAERHRIAGYINLDQVGSPNAAPELYSDGDRRLTRVLRRAAGGRLGRVAAGGGSDHAPFRDAGIPITGLYTGGPERGRRGRPRDPCYHLPCDNTRNVDRGVLLRMTRAAEGAIRALAAQAK